MLARFPRLSKVTIKILEIAGAGCASAMAATLLGNTREVPAPPTPPAVVRLAPVDEQMIRFVRDEGSALVEQLRSASDQRSTPGTAPAPVSQPARAAKPAAIPSRREQKSTAAPSGDSKQRSAEVPTVHAAAAVGSDSVHSVTTPAAPAAERMPPPPSAAADLGAASAQTQVPLRLWPAAVNTSLPDAPRPPASVGEFVSRSM
jgi:hypothetical protein